MPISAARGSPGMVALGSFQRGPDALPGGGPLVGDRVVLPHPPPGRRLLPGRDVEPYEPAGGPSGVIGPHLVAAEACAVEDRLGPRDVGADALADSLDGCEVLRVAGAVSDQIRGACHDSCPFCYTSVRTHVPARPVLAAGAESVFRPRSLLLLAPRPFAPGSAPQLATQQQYRPWSRRHTRHGKSISSRASTGSAGVLMPPLAAWRQAAQVTL